ncbi:MAG: hypothetical protein H6595_12140 [Flavobacteriales bacterium]|nr:hypothetical protein [Flavobacteriales bacterium]MCB9168212.1 hypothetical protein [Flavobacteriales bacterium]
MKTPMYLVLMLTLATSGTTDAQEIRLSGGYNGSDVGPAKSDGWVGRAGYQFSADLLLGHRLFFRTGTHFLVRNLNYSYVPANGDGVPSEVEQEYRYTERCLYVPAQLGFRFFDPVGDPTVNLYVVGGPSALFTLDTHLSDAELDVRSNSAMVLAGGGLGVTIGFLFVEGGYHAALDRSLHTSLTDPKVNMYYIMGGVRLQLAR